MDRNYPGPCPSCCDQCAILTGAVTSIVVTVSGMTICPCYIDNPAASSAYKVTATLNGAYTLTSSMGAAGIIYSATIADAITTDFYNTADCSGDIDHTVTSDLYIQWTCENPVDVPLMRTVIPGVGTVNPFEGTSPSSQIHDSILNNITSSACNVNLSPSVFAYGGSMQLTFP